MKRRLQLVFAAGFLFAGFGCHCLPVTERYCDAIDRVADHEVHLDRHYRPAFDVTRWGMWNGPECCRPNCCR
ncbi:MAG: hypothetical protein RIK87_16075 [Fuerstiella sp.]